MLPTSIVDRTKDTTTIVPVAGEGAGSWVELVEEAEVDLPVLQIAVGEMKLLRGRSVDQRGSYQRLVIYVHLYTDSLNSIHPRGTPYNLPPKIGHHAHRSAAAGAGRGLLQVVVHPAEEDCFRGEMQEGVEVLVVLIFLFNLGLVWIGYTLTSFTGGCIWMYEWM